MNHAYLLKKKNKKLICIVLYVDDILITGNKQEIKKTAEYLISKYTITDVGDANFIIGIKFEKINCGYLIHQERYLNDVLNK